MDDGADSAGFEEAFVEVAKSYSDRQGISYAAWRTVGVAPEVLRRAGVTRSSWRRSRSSRHLVAV